MNAGADVLTGSAYICCMELSRKVGYVVTDVIVAICWCHAYWLMRQQCILALQARVVVASLKCEIQGCLQATPAVFFLLNVNQSVFLFT